MCIDIRLHINSLIICTCTAVFLFPLSLEWNPKLGTGPFPTCPTCPTRNVPVWWVCKKSVVGAGITSNLHLNNHHVWGDCRMEALLSKECQNLCAAVHFPQQLLRTQCCSMAKQFWLQPKQPGPAQQPTVPTARRDHGTYFIIYFINSIGKS